MLDPIYSQLFSIFSLIIKTESFALLLGKSFGFFKVSFKILQQDWRDRCLGKETPPPPQLFLGLANSRRLLSSIGKVRHINRTSRSDLFALILCHTQMRGMILFIKWTLLLISHVWVLQFDLLIQLRERPQI